MEAFISLPIFSICSFGQKSSDENVNYFLRFTGFFLRTL